jgi:poly-gamma-glutamate synthesis protein (capsule biosynthesis protein)
MSSGGRRGPGLAAALVLTLGVACSGEEPAASPERPTPRTSAPVAPTSPPAPTPRPSPLTIALAGDVHFEGVLRDRLDDPATALAPATATLAAADLAIVNLETAVGTGGRRQPGERYSFQAPPSAFRALAEAGVDVATMANNHALDFGRAPLSGMFEAVDRAALAEAPLAVVGIGRDVDAAFRPAHTDVGGTVVATIGASVADADPTADPSGRGAATEDRPGTADAMDPARLLRAVRVADRSADVVVVYLHWGIQGERCPSDGQRALAGRVVGAGADVVVGSHTHGLQGDGRLGRGYVAYGLGNYAWYTPTAATGVLTLTVRPPASREGRARVTDAAWDPARIGADGLPRPFTDPDDTAAFDRDLAALRACAGFSG